MFDSATDPSFVVLEKAFFDLLCRLLRHRPYAVHAALDEHVRLVWPKCVVSGSSRPDIIDFASAVQSLSYTYQTYWKHSNPSPSGEVEALVLFLTSPPVAIEAIVGEWAQRQGQHVDALVSAVGHLSTSLSSIAASSFPRVPGDPQAAGHFDIVDNRDVPETPQLADTHPGLSFDILAHPALPFIFLAAELAWQSAHAVTFLNSISDDAPEGSPEFAESLFTLWKSSLKFAHEGRQGHPMRLAVCYLFACMAASAHRADKAGDSTAMTGLTRRITSSPQNIMWLWDVSFVALSMQVHHANKGTGTLCNGEEEFLAAYAHRLPSILHLFHRVFEAEHSTLLKVPLDPDHSSPQRGPSCRDARLVSAILYSAISSLSWKAVLDMFGISVDEEKLSQLVGDAYEYGRIFQSESDLDDGHRLSSDTDEFPAHLLSAARRNAVSRYTVRKPSLMQQVLAELDKGARGHNIDLRGEWSVV